jgi:hypothetical protein
MYEKNEVQFINKYKFDSTNAINNGGMELIAQRQKMLLELSSKQQRNSSNTARLKHGTESRPSILAQLFSPQLSQRLSSATTR